MTATIAPCTILVSAMADKSPAGKLPAAIANIAMNARAWAAEHLAPAQKIQRGDSLLYGGGPATISALLGGPRREARGRHEIYETWSWMEGDPIVSAAIKLLVTTALGGHETTGDVVMIEATPAADDDKALGEIAKEIKDDLTEIFNQMAYTMGYRGAVYGDAYCRNYAAKGEGLKECDIGELLMPPLVQPYERGNRTVGYEVFLGQESWTRLNMAQMGRLKMPRTQWIPQTAISAEWIRARMGEDDLDKIPHMPAMVGGSLLFPAEEPYDRLYAALTGLVGQRWLDSMDELMLQVNLQGMTADQQTHFLTSIQGMLQASKARSMEAVKSGRPVLERVRHIIPVFGEKQLTTVSAANGGASGRPNTISIEDVMFHAKMLSGALGVDISMLGFADLLSGGLGDGGFFRTSAQAAEASRQIRGALSDFYHTLIDVHTYYRYGVVFHRNQRPCTVNFYGSISALEAERAKTEADAMNATAMMITALQQMKDLGMSVEMIKSVASKRMKIPEEEADLYAKLADMAPPEGGGGDFGGDAPKNPAAPPGFGKPATPEGEE